MGTQMTLTAADGHKLSAYRAEPEMASKEGLVVLQEIFGVNKHIRSVADRFAHDGFIAAAPALFDRVSPGFEIGYSPDEVARGRETRAKVTLDEALADTQAAIDALKEEGLKVGVVGYCWGGGLAWAAATRLKGVTCAVCYYGGLIPELADEDPKCPVMLHFGEDDQSIPMDKVEVVRAKHPTVPLFTYPGAGHGFNCDLRGSYDADAAAAARQRTLTFLREHLV
ncbi:MAG: dienelactone hydrolase family protein [Hyphomicrobiales bacterium]|nr:dienelactone hydrolase family protein [Hyphomicrobiales bacterium]